MELELKSALDNLSIELQGKSVKEIATAMDAFETKMNGSFEFK